jgi:hypothetical protein
MKKFRGFQRLAVVTRRCSLNPAEIVSMPRLKPRPPYGPAFNCAAPAAAQPDDMHRQRSACGRPRLLDTTCCAANMAIFHGCFPWLFSMAVFHGDFSDDPGKPALHGSVLRFAPPYY